MHDRHDLVRLSAQGWEQALAGLSGEAAALGMYWRAHHLPAVVRRTEPGTPPGTVCLGIPAPPDARSGQKLRVGFTVAQDGIESARAPLTLDETVVPAEWQTAFDALRDGLHNPGNSAGIDCRVFGSVAMQTLTGQRYLTPSSDIDLLLRPVDARQLDAALAVLRLHAQRLPLDGEIVFPSGHAVSWKEWLTAEGQAAQGGDRVLAKHIDSVALLRRDALLEQLMGQFREIHHG